jgi:hypothetical protein
MEVTLKLLSVVHQAVEVHLGFVSEHLAGMLYHHSRLNNSLDEASEFTKIVFHFVFILLEANV